MGKDAALDLFVIFLPQQQSFPCRYLQSALDLFSLALNQPISVTLRQNLVK
jgi:hypothetical protein